MIYLFESKIPENKSIYFSLCSIYGINKNRSVFICKQLGFSLNLKLKFLSISKIDKLIKAIESSSFIISNDLKRVKLLNNQRLLTIKSYRGLRKKKGFPVRGQRTHTNARTAKKQYK